MAEQITSSYVVLRQTATNDEKFPAAWVVLDTVEARSQLEAIKAIADPANRATYAAVPSRSWAPVPVVPHTVTTFAIETPTDPPPVHAAPAVEATP